jgi:hypothetical protein
MSELELIGAAAGSFLFVAASRRAALAKPRPGSSLRSSTFPEMAARWSCSIARTSGVKATVQVWPPIDSHEQVDVVNLRLVDADEGSDTSDPPHEHRSHRSARQNPPIRNRLLRIANIQSPLQNGS